MSRLGEQEAVRDACCIHVSTDNVTLGIDPESLRCANARGEVVDRKEPSSGHHVCVETGDHRAVWGRAVVH